MKHEILEEVWRVRDKISAECGHDLKKLVARLKRIEPQYADRLVRLPARRKLAATNGRKSARKHTAARDCLQKGTNETKADDSFVAFVRFCLILFPTLSQCDLPPRRITP